jgi:hypothetical protein
MKPLPCPFCGEMPVMMPVLNTPFRSFLLMCEAEEYAVNPASTGPTEEITIKRWNHRAPVKEAA